jgi:hypothetical protein
LAVKSNASRTVGSAKISGAVVNARRYASLSKTSHVNSPASSARSIPIGGFADARSLPAPPPTWNPIFTVAGSPLVVRVSGGFALDTLAGDGGIPGDTDIGDDRNDALDADADAVPIVGGRPAGDPRPAGELASAPFAPMTDPSDPGEWP